MSCTSIASSALAGRRRLEHSCTGCVKQLTPRKSDPCWLVFNGDFIIIYSGVSSIKLLCGTIHWQIMEKWVDDHNIIGFCARCFFDVYWKLPYSDPLWESPSINQCKWIGVLDPAYFRSRHRWSDHSCRQTWQWKIPQFRWCFYQKLHIRGFLS